MQLKLDGALNISRQSETMLIGDVVLGLDAQVPLAIVAVPGLQEIVDGILDRVAGNLQTSLEQSLLQDYVTWAAENRQITDEMK